MLGTGWQRCAIRTCFLPFASTRNHFYCRRDMGRLESDLECNAEPSAARAWERRTCGLRRGKKDHVVQAPYGNRHGRIADRGPSSRSLFEGPGPRARSDSGASGQVSKGFDAPDGWCLPGFETGGPILGDWLRGQSQDRLESRGYQGNCCFVPLFGRGTNASVYASLLATSHGPLERSGEHAIRKSQDSRIDER